MGMTPELRAAIVSLQEAYPEPRGALLPALHRVQAEKGWISDEDAIDVAALFELAPAEVREVLSFYSMFYTQPQGRHHVHVCTSLSCSLRGSGGLLRALEQHLGVSCGQTTSDGRITLGREPCLGSCGSAPVLRVDEEYLEGASEQSARERVDGLD